MTSTARELATFLATVGPDAVPGHGLDTAAMFLASTLASAGFGASIPSAQVMRQLARDRRGPADSTMWFSDGPKMGLFEVGQANAVSSGAAACDDSDLRNIVHAGSSMTAVVLALGERLGSSGSDVLMAMLCGYEASGRIGAAITRRAGDGPFNGTIGFDLGFHGCVAAVFAPTVAAGRLLGLDPERMTTAIALTATSIGGLMVAANTSTAREYHDGLSVMVSLQSVLAAERGYQAEERVLEAPKGFFEAIGGFPGASGREIATHALGDDWQLLSHMSVKLYPGAHPYHAYAEAAADAAIKGDIRPEEIVAIEIWDPGMDHIAGPSHPVNLVDMAHSQRYFVAAGLVDRTFTWAHAEPAKYTDPEINRLTDLIVIGDNPGSDPMRYRQGGSVTVRTRDGAVTTSTVYEARGTVARGLSWADIDAKARALMPRSGMSSAQIEDVLTAVHRLNEMSNISELTSLLTIDGD